MWGEQLQMAWQSLRANTFRSLLTMLGIIIGSSTLVSVLSLGNALQGQVFERFIDLGTRRVAVLPGDADAAGARITSGYGLLSIKDFRALEKLVADRPDIFRTVVPEVAIQVRARFSGPLPNKSSVTRAPITATRCDDASSSLVKKRPYSSGTD